VSTGQLAGKTAVVTGGGSGIGRASALRFAAEGARVFVWDLDPSGVESTVKAIEAEGGAAAGTTADISGASSVSKAAEQTIQALGSIDVLMNNAGILDGYAPILDTNEALWDRIVGVNLKGPYLVTRALLPTMIAGGGGAVVNTASIAGLVAGGGGIAYTAAKHGVIGFTKQLSFDYGKQGIRANAILPGAVETGMTRALFEEGDAAVMESVRSVPAGRHAQPEEIANVALFLASDQSSFAHGASFVADGGWTIQ
jgi:3-oxoacyl-[acyl-carrier protein] reductase